MKTASLFFLFICFSFYCAAFTKPVTKIVCAGTSITYGATLPNRGAGAYPVQLQQLLGKNYEVLNYGVSGSTLLQKGDLPYVGTKAYQLALQSNPDIVLIELGTNDTKLLNRPHLVDFEKDYLALIHSFKQLASHPQVILLLPAPMFTTDKADSVLVHDIIPKIQRLAYEQNLQVIDMHSLLLDKEDLIPDKVHPGEKAFTIIATRLFELLVQQKDGDFDIFHAIPTFDKKLSSFYGYPCADFTWVGTDCKIVKPKWAAAGHPFVWRARFWGHEPQADIALLERGFHIVYCNVVELYGNTEAIERWNKFYDFLQKAGLSKKAALEGMSRGGVYVFNWAAVNPDKIACVYVDNPVLDLKSWPGGKGKGPGSASDWEIFKKDYGFHTEAEAMTFSGSPVDKTAAIVKGKYPILVLCADADEAVPAEENTFLFAKRIKDNKGNITVIIKHGFRHHPHSLPNPAPIVDFILKATGFK